MKPLALIGLVGKKHSGKDECFTQLYKAFEAEQISAMPMRLSFGDEVKKEIAELLGTDVAHINANKELLREILQNHGHGKRISDSEYWINKSGIKDVLKKEHLFPCFTVVTDIRYPNEAEIIKSLGGKLIRIRRKLADMAEDKHPTETMLEHFDCDGFVYNDETPARLRFMLMDEIKRLTNAII